MKNLTFLLLLTCTSLFADYNLENVAGWEIEKPSQERGPFQLSFSGDWIGDSKFTKDSVAGDHIRYGTWETELDVQAYCDPCHGEGANVALAFDQTRLEWECNPFFDRRTFNTAKLSLLLYTHCFCNWSLIGQATYRIDANHWSFIDESSYDWLAWGRWAYSDRLGFHMGVFGQSGLRLPLVLPIVGFDWQFLRDWKLSLVFPVNLSLLYTLDDCWSLALRGRWWSDRNRVGSHEHLSKAVWRYTNYGIETATLYTLNSYLWLDLHAGCAFEGWVKVAHRRGSGSEKLHFRPAAYFGGELVLNF